MRLLLTLALNLGVLVAGCFLDHGPPAEDAGFDVPDAEPCMPGEACDCRAVDLVPAGTHVVGANLEDACDPETDPFCPYFGGPAHETILTRAVFVGRFEASSGCWSRCVREGACEDTSVLGCEEGHCQGLKTGYWRDPANALLPVAYLTYEGATDYCSFLGGRLPTNAEWEKAARGENGRRWPWAETLGDDPFNIDREERAAIDAMWNDGDVPAHRPPGAEGGDLLIAIDSFPEGRGPYGHYGLMGNAWEWIFDRMELYGTDRLTDPTGPATADIPGLRILRPGPDYIWDRLLERDDPAEHVDRLGSRLWPQGTRCAFDVEPDALPMWE